MAKRTGRASGPTARAREMAGMLGACDRSGLSQTAFARRRGIAPGTLGWWRHRLRGRGAPGDRPARFVEVVAVPSVPPIAPGRFELVLPGGAIVRVPASFDGAALRRVLAALAAPC